MGEWGWLMVNKYLSSQHLFNNLNIEVNNLQKPIRVMLKKKLSRNYTSNYNILLMTFFLKPKTTKLSRNYDLLSRNYDLLL